MAQLWGMGLGRGAPGRPAPPRPSPQYPVGDWPGECTEIGTSEPSVDRPLRPAVGRPALYPGGNSRSVPGRPSARRWPGALVSNMGWRRFNCVVARHFRGHVVTGRTPRQSPGLWTATHEGAVGPRAPWSFPGPRGLVRRQRFAGGRCVLRAERAGVVCMAVFATGTFLGVSILASLMAALHREVTLRRSALWTWGVVPVGVVFSTVLRGGAWAGGGRGGRDGRGRLTPADGRGYDARRRPS